MTDDITLAMLIDDLVVANRILAERGVLDGFGHVSARDPRRADRYRLSRSLAPSFVTRNAPTSSATSTARFVAPVPTCTRSCTATRLR